MKNYPLHTLGFAIILAGLAATPALSMDKESGMKRMEQTGGMAARTMQQSAFSKESFEAAQASGLPFVVAFHKKGCPLCIKQQAALNQLYTDPAYNNLRVLVVDYLNDTQSLKTFNVGMQGTLIVFEGNKEVSRTQGLTETIAIEKQLRG